MPENGRWDLIRRLKVKVELYNYKKQNSFIKSQSTKHCRPTQLFSTAVEALSFPLELYWLNSESGMQLRYRRATTGLHWREAAFISSTKLNTQVIIHQRIQFFYSRRNIDCPPLLETFSNFLPLDIFSFLDHHDVQVKSSFIYYLPNSESFSTYLKSKYYEVESS